MPLKLTTKNGELLHAYCLLGECNKVKNDLLSLLENEYKIQIKGNSDFWCGDYNVLGVDESRLIKDSHLIRPTMGEKKYFVISANFITEQAQNAMLKMFEEPSGHTHIFLISPMSKNLIPTLKSRLNIVEIENEDKVDGNDFLYSDLGQRMKTVKELMSRVTDEKESKISVINLLNSLEQDLSSIGVKENAPWLEKIEKVRLYAMDQSPSLKLLLEHISLVLPVFKRIKK